MPGTDVKAGTNTKAPDLIISGNGIELLGAFRPVWKTDGSRISYRNGLCLVSSVPASPPTGEMSFTPLFGGKHPAGACVWDWGPTADLKNQLIYSENSTGEGSNIFLLKEGGIHPGQRLTDFTNLPYQIPGELRWTPDGSGVLYSMTIKGQPRENFIPPIAIDLMTQKKGEDLILKTALHHLVK